MIQAQLHQLCLFVARRNKCERRREGFRSGEEVDKSRCGLLLMILLRIISNVSSSSINIPHPKECAYRETNVVFGEYFLYIFD